MIEYMPDGEGLRGEEWTQVRCVWVLSGAPDSEPPVWLDRQSRPDKVVVADGGAALALRLGIRPDLLIGDLDSISPDALAELKAAGTEIEQYEHHIKQETDTELAVLAALRWQPERIIILGAIGGRLDHALANVFLLTHPALTGLEVSIVDQNQELFLARTGAWNVVSGQKGDLLSLLPVGEDTLGVKTEKLMYPLAGETLPSGRGRGVSNELLDDNARVWLDSGKLLVVITHL